MEAYLQDMASQGWYLKWCKSVLAGFERRDDPPLSTRWTPWP